MVKLSTCRIIFLNLIKTYKHYAIIANNSCQIVIQTSLNVKFERRVDKRKNKSNNIGVGAIPKRRKLNV